MVKVWLVISEHWEDWDPIAAYTTPEAAQARADAENRHYADSPLFRNMRAFAIGEDIEVDPPDPDYLTVTVTVTEPDNGVAESGPK